MIAYMLFGFVVGLVAGAYIMLAILEGWQDNYLRSIEPIPDAEFDKETGKERDLFEQDC